ncbi:MAG: hypothetical protein SFW36_00180 [Leptolyngbyaceae cyanobacterium bins.59]|nr:hypothetical protein [Leptolyngbyaceae cyanobacterium bins.59]
MKGVPEFPSASSESEAIAEDLSSFSPDEAEPEVSVEAPLPPPVESRVRRKNWFFPIWTLIWLMLLGASGAVGVHAFLTLTRVAPPPNCQQDVARLEEDAQLYCTELASQGGDLNRTVKGLTIVNRWPKDHPRYTEARRLMTRWSGSVLLMARQKAAQDDLKNAITIAQRIPAGSPLHREAQGTIALWKQDLDQGEAIYTKAIAALKKQDFRRASEQAQVLARLSGSQWPRRARSLRQLIQSDEKAWDKLQEAQALADTQAPDLISEAIALAQSIGAKSYVRSPAQESIARWSRTLLQIATDQLQAKEFEVAIATARRIPPKSALGDEAQQFIRVCQAEQLMTTDARFSKPLPEQIWVVGTALIVANTVERTNPLYNLVQPQISDWKKQLEDLKRLQFASSIASFGNISAYQWAIDQASAITPDRPRRTLSQTLIAQWRKEIQRREDMPLLERARQLAAQGTPNQIQAAIKEARKVPIGRALRIEAQTEIAKWNRQLEILEDQPILNQARALAKQSKYLDAIQKAEEIAPNRALHAQAQTLISGWAEQIRVVEDRSILNEANLLASYREYNAAISAASRIGEGRPLYWEAQTAISEWQASLQVSQTPVPPPEPISPSPSPEDVNIPAPVPPASPDPNAP